MEETILTARANSGKCPVCGVNQYWGWHCEYTYEGFSISHTGCPHCQNKMIFYGGELIYPKVNLHIKPNELLKKYSKSEKLFNESVGVANDSPRAALALSRMCLESLVKDILIGQDKTLADTFSKNVDKLLDCEVITSKIKKRLDDTRVIGNKAIHNFNIIETDNDPTLDDCMLVWKAINNILDSLKLSEELDLELPELANKIKDENTGQ